MFFFPKSLATWAPRRSHLRSVLQRFSRSLLGLRFPDPVGDAADWSTDQQRQADLETQGEAVYAAGLYEPGRAEMMQVGWTYGEFYYDRLGIVCCVSRFVEPVSFFLNGMYNIYI